MTVITRLKVSRISKTFAFFSERKVQPDEYPHALYIANYSTAAATCLIVKRWLFDPETEMALYSDRVALEFLFQYVRSNDETLGVS